MHPVSLVLGLILLFSVGHGSNTGTDPAGCSGKTCLYRAGFFGRIETHKMENIPAFQNANSHKKYCSDLLSNLHKHECTVIAKIENVTSANFDLPDASLLYGVPVKTNASVTMSGWWYAPMSGKYLFELQTSSAGRLDIGSHSSGEANAEGVLLDSCPSSNGQVTYDSNSATFRGGLYYSIQVILTRGTSAGNFSVSVTLPNGNKIDDIGSMVYQRDREEQSSASSSSTGIATSFVSSSTYHQISSTEAVVAPRTTTVTKCGSFTYTTSITKMGTDGTNTVEVLTPPARTTTTSSGSCTKTEYKTVTGTDGTVTVEVHVPSSSFQYSSSTSVWSSSEVPTSSSTPSLLPTSIEPSPCSSHLPSLATQSNSALTTMSPSTTTTISTAKYDNTTELTFTSVLTSILTYCPECESSAAEPLSIPTSTKTETVVITTTNSEGQTVTLTKTITVTYCPESDLSDASQTTSDTLANSALSTNAGNTVTDTKEVTSTVCLACTDSGNGSEIESGPVPKAASTPSSKPTFTLDTEPAFTPQDEPESEPEFTFDSVPAYTYESGMDFTTISTSYSTVSKIALSTISKKASSSVPGNGFSTIVRNGSSVAQPTAAVSTYDGSGSTMGMISSLAILPLFALLI